MDYSDALTEKQWLRVSICQMRSCCSTCDSAGNICSVFSDVILEFCYAHTRTHTLLKNQTTNVYDEKRS